MSLENENKNYDDCNTEAISTSEDCNCDNTDYNCNNYMDYYNNVPTAPPIPPYCNTPYGYGMVPYGMLPMQPQPYSFTNNDIYNEPYYDYENDDNTEDDICEHDDMDDDINNNNDDNFNNLTRSSRNRRRRRRRRRYDYPYYYPGGFPFWLWWFL